MYNSLKVKNILLKNIQYPKEDLLIDILEESYKKTAFSTFPKLLYLSPSYKSYIKYNSGNCISLSYWIKLFLKLKYKIDSFLIPATIPNIYKRKGYLDISHVALAVPYGIDSFYIIDPAFYFLCPAFLNINKNIDTNTNILFSKNIYEPEYQTNLKDYKSIDIIKYNKKYYKNKYILNKYQTIPENTYSCECNYMADISDKWEYFLCEVLNPESAISSFFYAIKKEPFLVSCYIDENGILSNEYHIRIKGNNIEITEYNKSPKIFNINNLKENILEFPNLLKSKKIRDFLGGDIIEVLSNYVNYI